MESCFNKQILINLFKWKRKATSHTSKTYCRFGVAMQEDFSDRLTSKIYGPDS